MFDKTAEYYDRFYSSFKDYEAETEKIAELIRGHNPAARTVLDVGCGPGKHASILNLRHDYEVDGIDSDPTFIEAARDRVPSGEFLLADMRNFDTGKTYDAVICLFSAIGYMVSLEDLFAAVSSMHRHTASGGVLIVEPWLKPEDFNPGTVKLQTLDEDDIKIARMSRGDLLGRVSHFEMKYLIGDREGVRYEAEVHDLGLFTTEEMIGAFKAVGLDPVYVEEGLIGRGLYIAVRP